MGGDAKDLFISSSFFLTKNTKVFLDYNYEKRELSLPNPESQEEVRFGLKQRISKAVNFNLKGGLGDRKNRLIEFSFELTM